MFIGGIFLVQAPRFHTDRESCGIREHYDEDVEVDYEHFGITCVITELSAHPLGDLLH